MTRLRFTVELDQIDDLQPGDMIRLAMGMANDLQRMGHHTASVQPDYRWEWTFDPDDPCALCVQWVGSDDDPEQQRPIMPSGPVYRVCRTTHPRCRQEVEDMVAAQRLEGRDG